jgi:hypothetical protein
LAGVPPLRRMFKSPKVWCDSGGLSAIVTCTSVTPTWTAWSAGSTPRARVYLRFECGIEHLIQTTCRISFFFNDPQDVIVVLQRILRRSCPYPIELNPRICRMQVPFARALHGSRALEFRSRQPVKFSHLALWLATWTRT